jgi:hypothetical protein
MTKKYSKSKKILALLVLLVIVYFLFLNKEQTPKEIGTNGPSSLPAEEDTDKTLFDKISNSKISVPDQNAEVELEEGYGEFQIEETTVEGFVSLENVYTVVEAGGEKNLFGVASVSPGGSGVFQYLVWYKESGKEIITVSSIFFGDRTAIDKISAKQDGTEIEITLETRERKEDEPMTEEPSVKKTRIFKTSGNTLIEI